MFTQNLIIEFGPATLNVVERLISQLSQVSDKETQLMSTLDDDIAAVAAQTTAVGGLATFISSLENQIKALGITPAQQAQIDAIFANVTANNAAIAAALVQTSAAPADAPVGHNPVVTPVTPPEHPPLPTPPVMGPGPVIPPLV